MIINFKLNHGWIKGRRLRPPFFLASSKCFWNVNVTLLLYVLKSEVFIRSGGGWGSRPPLSEFSGSAPAIRTTWSKAVLSRILTSLRKKKTISNHFKNGATVLVFLSLLYSPGHWSLISYRFNSSRLSPNYGTALHHCFQSWRSNLNMPRSAAMHAPTWTIAKQAP